jgi:hypothetical protein
MVRWTSIACYELLAADRRSLTKIASTTTPWAGWRCRRSAAYREPETCSSGPGSGSRSWIWIAIASIGYWCAESADRHGGTARCGLAPSTIGGYWSDSIDAWPPTGRRTEDIRRSGSAHTSKQRAHRRYTNRSAQVPSTTSLAPHFGQGVREEPSSPQPVEEESAISAPSCAGAQPFVNWSVVGPENACAGAAARMRLRSVP